MDRTYKFHYARSRAGLTCFSLAAAITASYRPGEVESGDAGDSTHAAGDHWEVLRGALDWHLLGEGKITLGAQWWASRGVDPPVLRAAVQAAHAEVVEQFPALVGRCSKGDLLQLIALGKDVVRTAAESPDMLAFFKKELQPVDLGGALGL
jgi:hypothetical protein